MACVARIHAVTNDYDLRADTREELDAAIEKVAREWDMVRSSGRTYHHPPKITMGPLQMLNGQWRAIVIGEPRHFTATEEVISNVELTSGPHGATKERK